MASHDLWGWEQFFGELSSFMREIDRQTGSANFQYSEFVVERLEMFIVSITRLIQHFNSHSSTQDEESTALGQGYSLLLIELVHCLRSMLRQWQDYLHHYEVRSSSSYSVSVVQASGRGRPKFNISRDQLQYLCSMSFTWVEIAKILGVSRMTVYRRRRELGLTEQFGTVLSNNDLHELLRHMRQQFPALGQTMVWGQLRSLGFRVTRARVREAIRVTDPIHTALRWRQVTPRRLYSVPGPNSLWHIDGHHKLIRWRFVTHCAIDGFSRLVLFIKCSNNNRSGTVYDSFLKSVRDYGLPSRIRCDQGGENILVAQHVLQHRGEERRSVLVGSSVHNQRIERLWRDSHRCVTSMFYKLFYYLEQNDLLNQIDEVELFALHYVFLPRINRSLQLFRLAWNDHGLRTERGNTPNQLFTMGSLRLRHSRTPALDFFEPVSDGYGVEEEGIAPDNEDGIEVPSISVILTDEQNSQLQASINPLEDSDDYGISLYTRTLQLLRSWNIIS